MDMGGAHRQKAYPMELEPFIITVSDREIRQERDKARALRKTQWWQTKISRGICHYCGRKLPASELTMDHLIPVIRGGKTTRGNCVPACKDCNSRKKYMLPIEWQEYLDRLSVEGTSASECNVSEDPAGTMDSEETNASENVPHSNPPDQDRSES